MTDANSHEGVDGPSPILGLSVLGLIAFVAGGSVFAQAPAADPAVARTGGLILLGLGLYAIVVGAVAVGVRLANGNR